MGAPTPIEAGAVRRNYGVLTALGSTSCYSLAYGIILPLLSLYAISIGGSASVIAAYTVAGTAANFVWRFFSGYLADYLGPIRLVQVGLVISTTASLLLLLIDNPWLLVPANVLIGLGAATFWPALRAVVILASTGGDEKALGRVASAQEAGATAGQALGGVVAGLLTLTAGLGLGSAVLLIGLAAALLLSRTPVTASIRPQPRATGDSQPAPPTGSSSPRSQIAVAAAVLLLSGIAISSFLPYLAIYVGIELGSGATGVGLTFAAFSVARFLAGLASGPVLHRYRQVARGRATLAPLIALAAAAMYLKSLAGTLLIFILVGVVAAFLVTLTHVLVMSSVTRLSRQRIASRVGLLEAFGLAGASLGPLLGVWVYTADPPRLFLSSAITLACAALVSLGWRSDAAAEEPRNEEG